MRSHALPLLLLPAAALLLLLGRSLTPAQARAADQRPPPAAPAAPAPITLTASDGTGLALVAVDARAVLQDPLAFAELHLTFQNPEDRVLEGQFRIALPRGASVTRFAMRTDQGWQEAEVVELQAARAAYEDFLHRRQDPALLEQAPGNGFSARVFPIPPRGVKELVISYVEERPGSAAPFRLPLAGLPRIGRLDAVVHDLTGARPAVHELHEQGVVPDGDLRAPPPAPPRGGPVALRDGELCAVRIRPVGDAPADPLRSALVLVDTSASRALGLDATSRTLEALARAVAAAGGKDAPFAVLAFDQDTELLLDGAAGALPADLRARLRDRGALGASDLAGALAAARKLAAAHPGRFRRVVLVSDGIPTAGAEDPAALAAAARALEEAGVERLDAIGVGGIRDQALLARLATAGLRRDGAALDGDLPAEVLVARLGKATRSGLAVRAEGARWVWPARLDGAQPGDEVIVYAAVPEGQPLRIQVGDARVAPAERGLAPAGALLLERAAARARVAALAAERDALPAERAEQREALRRAVVDLSVRERVLSPFTALLVLETDADYARFKIDRRAPARILAVGPGGLVLVDRPPALPPKQPPVIADRPRRDGHPAAKSAPAGAAAAAPAPAPATADAIPDDPGRRIEIEERGVPGSEALGAPAPSVAASAPPQAAPSAPAATAPAPAGLAREDVAPRSQATRRPAPPPLPAPGERRRAEAPPAEPEIPTGADPYTGPFAEIMQRLARREVARAHELAEAWVRESPGDVLALVALGEALEAKGDLARAARAYGSLVDLFPNRADLRRFAGERLLRVRTPAAQALAVDAFREAVAQRPDHPAGHRLLGFALLRAGEPAAAFDAIAAGLARDYPAGRFAGARQILAEDLGLVAAAWRRAEPARDAAIEARLAAAGGRREDAPSLRFVLVWETDANDVDFHIVDGKGARAYYAHRELPSGGQLYADVTTGYGPECFTIRGKPAAFPYRLQAHYYARGPMGYGMGALEIIRHDGNGHLTFEERPYVVMQDHAFVELGEVAR